MKFTSPYQRDGIPCAANAAHSSEHNGKGLQRQVLHPVRNPADAFSHLQEIGKGKPPRLHILYPPCPVPVPLKIKKSCLVPYCQAAGLPYCSPPAREYPSRLRLHKRHDTYSRWRQVTKLPRPCPQYPPFTLRYGKMLVLLKLAAHGDPGAATRRSQALRVAARAFEVILFGGAGQAGRGKQLPSFILPAPAGSHRARAWAACFTAPHSRRNLNTGYEQRFTLLFSNVRKREPNPLIM